MQEFRREVRVAQENSSSPSVVILQAFLITRFPSGSLVLLRIFTLAAIVQLVRGPRVAGDRSVTATGTPSRCRAHDVRSMDGVLEGRELT